MYYYNFFEKYQKILLWVANHRITSWLSGFTRLSEDWKKITKIETITPSSIAWKTGKKIKVKIKKKGFRSYWEERDEYAGMFFTRPRFAEALVKNFYPFLYLVHLWDTLFANNLKPAWNLGFDTLSVYSGAGDGSAGYYKAVADSWDNCHNAVDGTGANYTDLSEFITAVHLYTSPTRYQLYRLFLPFNTSVIGAGNIITSADLRVYCWEIPWNQNSISMGVVQTTQNSVDELVLSDYSKCGAVHGAVEGATRIPSTTGVGWWTWNLNSTGLAWISKTNWTKLGLRNSRDLDDVAPTGANNAKYYHSEYAGTDYDPYLYITYTPPAVEKTFTSDSILVNRKTKTLTADSFLLKQNLTKEFITDSILINRNTKTFLTDAFLLKALTKTFTSDSILIDRLTKAFTIDSVLLATRTKEFTIDALLGVNFKIFTTDALLKAIFTKTFTTDSIIIDRITKSFSTDSLLKGTLTKTFLTDAFLFKTLTKTFTSDSLLRKTLTKTFLTDALLKQVLTKAFSTDAFLTLRVIKTFTSDSVLVNRLTKSFITDAILKDQLTKTLLIDAILSGWGWTARDTGEDDWTFSTKNTN